MPRCKECGTDVQRFARKCPQCAEPMQRSIGWLALGVLIVVVAIIVLMRLF